MPELDTQEVAQAPTQVDPSSNRPLRLYSPPAFPALRTHRSTRTTPSACGCLFGRTILRMFANAILLSSFNNLSAQRASRFVALTLAFLSRSAPSLIRGASEASSIRLVAHRLRHAQCPL